MTFLSGDFTVMLAILAGIVTASLILKQRRSPMSATAWMLFIVAAPYIAIPAFIMFGIKRKFVHAAVGPSERRGEVVGDDAVDRMLDRYQVPPGTAGNDFRLIPDASEAREALRETIDGAKESIKVTLYALQNDATGREFVEALTRRAGEGVKVRVLLDSLGALRRPRGALRQLEKAGGEVRMFAPLIHGPLGPPINQRNHRKLVVADERVLWSGGRNVGDHYLAADHPHVWTDLTFVSTGPLVEQFVTLHASDWEPPPMEGRDFPEPEEGSGPSRLRLIPAGPDQAGDALHDLLNYLCHRADRRIWIATPYFVPTDDLWNTLAVCCRRGLEVRVLTPAKSNQRTADLARGPYLRELDEQGAEILLHDGMLHAKSLIIDDLAFVGSANFDARSLLLNYEATVLIETDADVGALEDWYVSLADKAVKGPPDASSARRALERLLRLIAPIL